MTPASETRWRGATVVCIASGPSLTKADCDVVRDARAQGLCKAITVNTSLERAPFADVLYASDYKWWAHYGEMVRRGRWSAFAGECWTCSQPAAQRMHLQFIRGEQGGGLSRRAGTIRLGGNSGHAMLSLAIEFGAARVVLLGYDMQRTGGASHWHGDHPHGLGNGGNFPLWVRRMSQVAEDLRGVEVLNASRATALKCFPRVTIEETLCTS